jgi:hypothetical protein
MSPLSIEDCTFNSELIWELTITDGNVAKKGGASFDPAFAF